MKIQAYLVKLSNGADVQIDADEVEKLMMGVSRGSMVRVRRGLVNPSFIVAVIPDTKRVREWLDDTKYQDAETQERRTLGIPPLVDAFSGVLPSSDARNLAKMSRTEEFGQKTSPSSFPI